MAIILRPYKDYKPVNLNFTKQIPFDWIVKRGKFFFKEISERSKKGEEQLLSVSEHKGIVPRESINVTMFQALSYEGYKLCNKGDIVINSLWAWHRGLGVSEYHGIVSTAYGIYRPLKSEQWNHRYLNYLLRDKTYVGECLIRSKGIWESRYQLTGNNFLDIPVLQPPLEVQNSIVAYLDKKNEQIDKFIRNKERLIELLEGRKKDIIDTAFTKGLNLNVEFKTTDLDWLIKIPKHWSLKRLKFLTEVISKGSTPSTEGREITTEGIRFLKAENIFKSLVTEEPAFFIDEVTHRILKRSQLKENDLLFVIAGATIGKVAVLPKEFLPANTNQAVSFIRLKKKIDVEFCYYWLHSNFITTNIWLKAVTSAQPNLAMEDLGNLSIPYPSDFEKEEIVKHVKEEHKIIDAAISKAQKEISSIKEYSEALITDLVTGKRSLNYD